MSGPSMDHQHHEDERVGVTVREEDGELNGHSSRSSSLSLEEVECVQNVASQPGGDTDSGCTTLDTLTSSESSVVCRPEQDHQGVIQSSTTARRVDEEEGIIVDNNQSTTQSRTEQQKQQQTSSSSQPSSNSRSFSSEQDTGTRRGENNASQQPSSTYSYSQQYSLPSNQQQQLQEATNSSRLPPKEQVREEWRAQEQKNELPKVGEASGEERGGEVNKLREDLKRLRIHLIQVEDGYTKELIESTEREEQLVAKLSAAEERIKWQEERIKESSDALKAAGRLVTSIDDKEVAIKKLRDEIARKTEEVFSLHKRIQELEESCENKLDKQLVKSLMVNYFTSPPELKKDVARLLVRILDFSEQELIKCGLMGHQSSVQQEAVQVATQFVQFLERESVPRSPQVPTLVPPSQSSALSKTPSTSSIAALAQSSSRSSFSAGTPTSSAIHTGTLVPSSISMTSTTSSPYRPAAPEAVKQLAKGLLNSSGNPFTSP